MRRKPNAGSAQFLAKFGKIPLDVPDGDLGFCLCTKNVASVAFVPDVPEQKLAQLHTEGYETVSIALPDDLPARLALKQVDL
jgi:hypothetical protein